jgi:protein phosphatase
MGGHAAGEVASQLAVAAIEEAVTLTAEDGAGVPPPASDPAIGLEQNRLKAAFHLADYRIGAAAAGDDRMTGMATTASAVLVRGAAAAVGHVGDSRVYLVRAGAITRLTVDHSWVEEQVRAGALSPEEARRHRWRNIVTRALSGGGHPAVDLFDVTLEPGDRVLLCSDGLSGVVDDPRIEELAGTGPLEAACDALVDAANRAGGPDNVTTVIVQADAD